MGCRIVQTQVIKKVFVALLKRPFLSKIFFEEFFRSHLCYKYYYYWGIFRTFLRQLRYGYRTWNDR